MEDGTQQMTITRRQLLQWTGTLAIAGSVAVGINITSWWNADPDSPYSNLNLLEGNVVNMVAGAAFPSGSTIELDGEHANLDRFFDIVLSSMSDENRTLLKLLLEFIDRATLPSHATHFSNLLLAARQTCIHNWLHNPSHLIRGAIQSLIVLLGMGYTAHPVASTHLSQYFRCGFGT